VRRLTYLHVGVSASTRCMVARVEVAKSMRGPKRLDGYPRYHAEVSGGGGGPVLAGIGRHYGIGVLASGVAKERRFPVDAQAERRVTGF